MNQFQTDKAAALLRYASMNRSCFVASAVFADETANFLSRDGDLFRFTIRTARGNADAVRLHVEPADGAAFIQRAVPAGSSSGIFDLYTAEVRLSGTVSYYYTIECNERTYVYTRKGLTDVLDPEYRFRCVPAFETPDWAKGAVMYQIYVDRFCNGDTANDVRNKEYLYLGNPARKAAWHEPVEPTDVCTFYGGDLKGVMDKMDYLQSLGVEVIYFNPIFVSPSNHKYDIQDYDHVDPHLGVIPADGGAPLSFDNFKNRHATMYMQRTTNPVNLEASDKLLCELIAQAHAKGIRVILDGVFNHCGAWNKWLDKENFYGMNNYPAGAYREEKSVYHDYFRWYDEAWPLNDAYDAWWGHDNHPKLHYESAPELRAYMLKIAAKWVSPPFNADGWRLDVAADLGYSKAVNHAFWRDFRRAVKEANPDAIILAEHYGDPEPWFDGTQWDTVMNYDAFMEPVTWFFTGMEKHSEEAKPELLSDAMAFESAMRYYAARFPQPALEVAMNQLSNHDHSRFLTRTNGKAGRLHTHGAKAADAETDIRVMLEAVVMQMTWPGAPTLYYGDEAGLAGWTDPDNRRPFPWGRENRMLTELHKALIRIRKERTALRRGSLEYLYMNTGIISYGRWLGDEVVIAAFNNNPHAETIRIPVWKTGMPAESTLHTILCTGDGLFHTERRLIAVRSGEAQVVLPPKGSVVLANV